MNFNNTYRNRTKYTGLLIVKLNFKFSLFLNNKEFENLSMEKKRFRLHWDPSPGLSIAVSFFPQKDFPILEYLNSLALFAI